MTSRWYHRGVLARAFKMHHTSSNKLYHVHASPQIHKTLVTVSDSVTNDVCAPVPAGMDVTIS
jgi:hypothetical protein